MMVVQISWQPLGSNQKCTMVILSSNQSSHPCWAQHWHQVVLDVQILDSLLQISFAGQLISCMQYCGLASMYMV